VPAPLSGIAFGVTGAEAVELALRLARLNRCTRLITMSGGFHGRTLGTLSVNGVERLRRPYAPLLPGVEVVPYDDVEAVEAALAAETSRAAVIVEPVQGEAGVRVPRAGYLSALARVCAAHDALLIADEVQTGLGRLGSWWGVDHDGVCPDILVAGKALGGGVLPVSAIAARPSVFRPFRLDPRQASSTFGGYPLGAAAVVATLAVMRDEDIVTRAIASGVAIAGALSQACAVARAQGVIRDVRGKGLLHGIEFDHPQSAASFADALVRAGVVPSYSSATLATVRLTPPADLGDGGLDALRAGLEAAVAAVRRNAHDRRQRGAGGDRLRRSEVPQ